MATFPKKNNTKRGIEAEVATSSAATEQPPAIKKPRTVRKFNFALHPKRKIALRFLYFGWEHDGLVQQMNTENTVERHLMNALLKTHLVSDPKNCDLTRCGRTDKGVSAFKQVAALIVRSSDCTGENVFWDEQADPDVIANYKVVEELPYIRMLNGVLPPTIRVTGWAPLPRDFSARYQCNKRIYKYSMPKANLNIERMQKACYYFIGEHDFRNFCQIDSNEARVCATYIRRIFDVRIQHISRNNGQYDLIELTVEGSGFLWHMIRYIVSVLHEIGQGNEEPELVAEMLDIVKTPCRPQYGLAKETPLCLFDCKYHLANLSWREDDTATQKTINLLQSTWAEFTTKAQLLQNMITDLQETNSIDSNRGLLQFTQDRPMPANYIPFSERPLCDSLETKLEKLRKKLKSAET